MQTRRKRIYCFLLVLLCTAIFTVWTEPGRVTVQAQEKKPYLIKVNRVYNTVTAYSADEHGAYTVPVRAMLCSVGAGGKTLKGTFKTKGKYRWKMLMGHVWGQYSTRIVNGILFHSVYYYGKMNPGTLATAQYNRLGTAASHGCIRLAVGDAKWIYDNCAVGTTVVIYDDKKSAGPLGKPKAIKLPGNVRWDPTDPSTKNPYQDKQPKISGVKNIKVEWGSKIKLLKGVKATSSLGADISKKVAIKGKVDSLVPGKYKITYSVTDSLDKKVKKLVTVTVLKNKTAPVIKGISNKVVNANTSINTEYAKKGIKAYCKKIKLSSDQIKVKIEKVSSTEYKIIYKASAGNGPVTMKKSKVYIDKEAPVITGIADYTLESSEVPTKASVLSKLTVSDNYTKAEAIKVNVWVTKKTDGSYLITCEAIDRVGNTAKLHATAKPAAQDQTTPTPTPTPTQNQTTPVPTAGN